MAKLTREEVLKLARLARLQLSEDEIKSFQTDISAILDFVEQLKDVDLGSLEPTYQVSGLSNVMREDKIIDYQQSTENLMQNAPASQDNQIKVRRML
jgi:aspartyl-tRNA(Asn)/glutamyl-tRNA(Gln) amidotransferase subunit C